VSRIFKATVCTAKETGWQAVILIDIFINQVYKHKACLLKQVAGSVVLAIQRYYLYL